MGIEEELQLELDKHAEELRYENDHINLLVAQILLMPQNHRTSEPYR